jgi:hypothetical protein
MSFKIKKTQGDQTFVIKEEGNFFIAYDENEKRCYGKININTGKFIGDTRCMIILYEMQENNKQILIDRVIEEIKKDVADGDLTAVDELLKFVPIEYLKNYLPEIL